MPRLTEAEYNALEDEITRNPSDVDPAKSRRPVVPLSQPMRPRYTNPMDDCIFCKIVTGEIPAKKIFEDDEILAFHDAAPQAPVHFLVVPRKHVRNIMEMPGDGAALAGRLLNTAQELAVKLGCGEKGARFVINCKADGGQTVDHLHVHVLGGRVLGWPPG